MKPIKSFEETLAEELNNDDFAKEFEKTKQELAILDQVIQCRHEAGLSQEALAKKWGHHNQLSPALSLAYSLVAYLHLQLYRGMRMQLVNN